MDQKSPTPTLLVVDRWITVLFAVLMVGTAALAGNGIFRAGSHPWLITGHQHTGNLLFAMGVLQMVVIYVLWTRKDVRGSVMATSALVFLLTFAQIGLGYMTRTRMLDVVGWHIALGVGLTAVVAMLATQLWMHPRSA